MTYKQVITVSVIMILTMVFLGSVNHSETIKPNKPFDTFPMTIGQWNGTTSRFDENVYEILGVDDSILATYRSDNGEAVHLYVGFYQSQREGDLIHSPKNCMPGSGWNITQTSIESVDVNAQGTPKTIDVIKLLLAKGTQKQVVLYWFQSRGRIISSEYMQKIWLVIDSITKQRTDGSFVRMIAPVVENEQDTVDFLKNFIQLIYPDLTVYIPA